MKKTNSLLLIAILILLVRCGDDSPFPMSKKYWTPDDYHDVNTELTSLKYNNKELPNLDNPKTAPVFKKIADTMNFAIVAADDQLGIKHRAEFMSNMFNEYRDLVTDYSILDRKDKYQYPVEFVEILKFGLALQVHYIEEGNQAIIKGADDPQAPDIVKLLNQNHNVLVRNYELYLDIINYEDRFSDAALASYSEGLSNFFPALITNVAPDGDYNEMLDKVNNMLKKTKNPANTAQLQNIQSLLQNKTQSQNKAG